MINYPLLVIHSGKRNFLLLQYTIIMPEIAFEVKKVSGEGKDKGQVSRCPGVEEPREKAKKNAGCWIFF
jgi:hypothetical protein